MNDQAQLAQRRSRGLGRVGPVGEGGGGVHRPDSPRSPSEGGATRERVRETVPVNAATGRRCFGDGDRMFEHYHDREWGFPVLDETGLFERMSLEAFQSGLSWRTILAKREAFRAAFAAFDPDAVARFGDAAVDRLLTDATIVRNRAKIEATLANARATV